MTAVFDKIYVEYGAVDQFRAAWKYDPNIPWMTWMTRTYSQRKHPFPFQSNFINIQDVI